MDAGHIAHHLSSGHLGIDTLLDDFSTLRLTENTYNLPTPRPKICLDAFRVFLRCQIDQDAAIVHHFPI